MATPSRSPIAGTSGVAIPPARPPIVGTSGTAAQTAKPPLVGASGRRPLYTDRLDWRKIGNHPTEGDRWPAYSTAIANELAADTTRNPGTYQVTTYDTFISALSFSHQGLVLSKEGYLVTVPLHAEYIHVIDPTKPNGSHIVAQLNYMWATNKYKGGFLAPNGFIYICPAYNTDFLKVDTTALSVTSIPVHGSVLNRAVSGAMDHKGCIYLGPQNSGGTYNYIQKFDTATHVHSTIAVSPLVRSSGGCLASNGYIYFQGEAGSTSIIKLDPSTDTYTTVAISPAMVARPHSWTLAHNGKLYGNGLNTLYELDPTTDTVNQYTNSLYPSERPLIQGDDGWLYSSPLGGVTLRRINPVNQAVEDLGFTLSATESMFGGCSDGSGNLYFLGNSASSYVQLHLFKVRVRNRGFERSISLSGYWNKF